MTIYTFIAVDKSAPEKSRRDLPGRAVPIDDPRFEQFGINLDDYPDLKQGIEGDPPCDVYAVRGTPTVDVWETVTIRTQPVTVLHALDYQRPSERVLIDVDETEITHVRIAYPTNGTTVFHEHDLVHFDPDDLVAGTPFRVKILRHSDGYNTLTWAWLNPATFAWLELVSP